MAKKRSFSTFSLSFLDIMSCGFGAVALIFLIIKHDVDTQIKNENQDLIAEVSLLSEEVKDGEEQLVEAKNTLSLVNERLAEAKGLARRINEDIDRTQGLLEEILASADDDVINKLKQDIKKLEKEKKQLEEENKEAGEDIRRFVGQGDRQYLTGINLGGSHILILLDASASMLDNTLVNVIRRRNMSDNVKKASKKWRRALSTVDWLTAQLPQDARVQLYSFNTQVKPAIPGTLSQWMNIEDRVQLEQANLNLRKLIPQQGTSLENAFASISKLDPLPDNLFIITDGLPTQGANKPKRNTITGPDRRKLFLKAVKNIPGGIPVNVILFPMEGDPFAASEFWKLAKNTSGSFISPSKDWP